MSDKIKKELVQVGKVLAAHKLSGEMKIQFLPKVMLKVMQPRSMFIGKSIQTAIPYFIQSFHPTLTNQFLIFLEEITTRESAQKLGGQFIFLNKAQVKIEAEEIDSSIVGYTIIDEAINLKGTVTDVMVMPHQTLIVFATDTIKEAMLPATDDTVRDISKKEKRIFVTLPDGLLDIY